MSDLNFLLTSDALDADEMKVLLPVGGGLDVCNGTYLKGTDGLWYLNGGLGITTGIVGGPNSQKSGLANGLALSAANRLTATHQTKIETYDTEINMHRSRCVHLSKQFESFKEGDIFKRGIWKIVDKSKMWGDEYFEIWKDFSDKKRKNAKKLMIDTPLQSDTGGNISILTPTISIFDSVTEFEHSDAATTQRDVKLGGKEALTVYMQLGLAKSRMFSAMTTMCEGSSIYTIFTAHIGDEPPAMGRPSHLPPDKQIHTIKAGDKIKGVSDKFLFLMSNSYQITKVNWLYNSSSDRTPKYPLEVGTNTVDLMLVKLAVLRSKSGPSGIIREVLMSQKNGFEFGLTDFYLIKRKNFGITGNNVTYVCDLMPDVKLSRTNIRKKLKEVPGLERAIGICSEMEQIVEFQAWTKREQICSPEVLYKDLKDLGYDWNKILLETRSWHTVNNNNHPHPTISTLTLLDMRLGDIDIPSLKVDK